MAWSTGEWAWSVAHDEPCRVIEVENLWDAAAVRVWLPTRDAVVRVPETGLRALDGAFDSVPERLTFIAAAARIADTLASDALISPLEGSVIPLPHQLHALSRAVSGDRVRYLLADEVGLGKTIEAGLIFRELKLRGLVTRVLIVAPAGLVPQWVAEMRNRFNEEFHMVLPSDFSALRQITQTDDDENLWRLRDQVVCPMDSVKPMDSRRGWSYAQVQQYNRERFLDLISAGWDPSALLMTVVREQNGDGHAVLMVRTDRGDLILDNQNGKVLLWKDTPYDFIKRQSQADAGKWVALNDDRTTVITAATN